MHDFLTVAAAAPLQIAGVTALELPPAYYEEMSTGYADRRDLMMSILAETGFEASPPAGAYYVMADCSHLGLGDDVAVAITMVEETGVAWCRGPRSSPTPLTARTLCASRSARRWRR